MDVQEEIKCPQCKGNRFKEMGGNVYKCAYCGTTFQRKANEGMGNGSTNLPPSFGEPMPSAGTYYKTTPPPLQPAAQPAYRPMPYSQKSKTTAAILAILIGGFGIHKFYLNQPVWGIVYIVFCWTYIPAIIALIEGIILLAMSEQDFQQKYNH